MRTRSARITIVCIVCGKSREIVPSIFKKGKAKFCSMSCRSKIAVATMVRGNREGRWREIQSATAKKSASKWNEVNHPRWMGDKAGYFAVHDWITKHFGQPAKCEVCGLDDPTRKYHWANLSHTYKRDRSDFKRMCVSCHRKYDYAAARANKQLEIAS